MRKISIALLVAMVLAGLFAMALADTAGKPTDTCSKRGGHGEWNMCQRKKTYRCQCHSGYGWCYTENKCKKGYYSCTSERKRRQHKKIRKKKRRSSSSCSSRTRKINTCNSKCVKGTLVNTCSTPYGYGTYAVLGGVNPSHKPQPAKKVCKETCVCQKGWTGKRCDRKRVKITYSKNMGKHCGKGTQCTRVITVKCRCKKHRSRTSSCSSSRRRRKGHKKNYKRKTSSCSSSRRRKGHKKNKNKHKRKTSTCTSSRQRRRHNKHKKHYRKTSTCTSSRQRRRHGKGKKY